MREKQQHEIPDDKSYLPTIAVHTKPNNDPNGWFVNKGSVITNCFENMGDNDAFKGTDAGQCKGGAGFDGEVVLSPFSYRGSAGSTTDIPTLRPPSSVTSYPPAWLTAPIGSTAIGRSVSHDSARKDPSPLFLGPTVL